jgi:hypothetical protein
MKHFNAVIRSKDIPNFKGKFHPIHSTIHATSWAALHAEILMTHEMLLKKHEIMVKADKKITTLKPKGTINKKDIDLYTRAHNEVVEAHKKWVAAQVRYFDFIEKKNSSSSY